LLRAEEAEEVVVERVSTVSADLPLRAVTEHILDRADLGAPGAALIDAACGTVITWPRLARTVRAAARGLGRRGLAAGDAAGVLVADAVSHAVAVHAVRAADGIAVPIRAADVAGVAGRLRACRARLLITTAPLADLAVEAAERSWVRQVYAFGEAAGTTSFCALTETTDDEAAPRNDGGARTAAGDLAAALRGQAGLAAQDPGLISGDVLVAAPPCGDPDVYTSLLDLAVVVGATIVAAPVAQVTAAVQAHRGTAAMVPCGTRVPLLPQPRVFALGLPGRRSGPGQAGAGSRALRAGRSSRGPWGQAASAGDVTDGRCCHRRRSGGRFSYGVLSTTVVRVETPPRVRICCSSSSSAAGDGTRTLRM